MVADGSTMAEKRREVGQQLRRARLDAGLTQTEVAAQIGTSTSYISEIENGRHNVTMDTLDAIATAIGVEVTIQIQPAKPKRATKPGAPKQAAKPVRRPTRKSPRRS